MEKLISNLFLFWIFFGLLPAFANIFNYQYIPAPDWVVRSSLIAKSVGIISVLAFLFRLWQLRSPFSDWGIKAVFSDWGIKAVLVVLFSPFFFFFIGLSVVTYSVPMVIAMVAGQETEMQFSVVSADGFGSKGCYSTVQLETPALLDKLCDVSDSFRKTLDPGDKILLIGRGTTLGLFPANARKLD